MKKIKVWNEKISDSQLKEVCDILENGGVAIIPTDTLYGICCDALNVRAVEKVCRIKGLDSEKNNLSIICSDLSMASEYSRIDNTAFRVIKDNTPGAFTFLLKSASTLPKAFKGRKIVGIRIPDNAIARKIAEYSGHPIMTTSIQADDEDYMINPELIAEKYADSADIMIEGEEGNTIPSTIVDLTGSSPEIIREGLGLPNT